MDLSPEVQARMILLVGGLVLMIIMCVGLLWMAHGLNKKSVANEQQVETAWGSLSRMLGLSSPARREREREMKGQYRGRPLSIYGRYAKGRNYNYTQVAVKVAYPADLYLQAISYKTVGMHYLPAGDPELDRRYYFRSDPPELLARTLASPAMRGLLLQSGVRWLTVSPYEVACSVRGVEKDQQRLLLLAELVSAAADAVGQVGPGLATQPPREPEHYLLYGARRIEGTAARIVLLIAVLALIACTVGGVVLLGQLLEQQLSR